MPAPVSYEPLNNLESDPAHDYLGKFSAGYIKDGKAAGGTLAANFMYKSIKIQGDFNTYQPLHQFTPNIISGNYELKNVSVINEGYQNGVIKELIFKTALSGHGGLHQAGAGYIS